MDEQYIAYDDRTETVHLIRADGVERDIAYGEDRGAAAIAKFFGETVNAR